MNPSYQAIESPLNQRTKTGEVANTSTISGQAEAELCDAESFARAAVNLYQDQAEWHQT